MSPVQYYHLMLDIFNKYNPDVSALQAAVRWNVTCCAMLRVPANLSQQPACAL